MYLMDLNSTNGTRINGEELKKNEKRRLMAEDIIEFAGVRYMFC
ncbi:MAG: FHA domain-containing protein [Coprococcus sp.]